MIEKEKMLRGELYNSSSDKDLVEDRERAKDLCFELNNTKPSGDNQYELASSW